MTVKSGKKRSRGRPSKYSPKLAEEICRRLSEGEPIVSICADPKMPSVSTVWRWERDNPEFCKLSARALEYGSHYFAHDCLRIADDTEIDPRHKRIMIDSRLRLFGKWNAKRYGDKVQVDQTTDLQEWSDEELCSELARQFRGMAADGIDFMAILQEAGVVH